MGLHDFYSPETLMDLLSPEKCKVDFVDTTGSTNDDMKKIVSNTRLKQPMVRVAVSQSSGKGTRGRTWLSEKGGFYFSIAIPMSFIYCSITLIPLAVGLGVIDALNGCGVSVGIKWPNDIWYRNGKAGGILCEVVKDLCGNSILIAGIGVNYFDSNNKTTNGWPIRGVGDIGNLKNPIDRTKLINDFIHEIFNSLMRDNKSIVDRWHRVDAFSNKLIFFETEKESKVGRMVGIDESGRLLLKIDGIQTAYSTGSIFPYDDTFARSR